MYLLVHGGVSISMKKNPNTGDASPSTALLSKSELDSELKASTLAAIAKLDSATVCRGCGSGWYNWGGSMGGAGGNWFGDSMCGMSGWCSAGGSRRKHKRNCVRSSYTIPHTICEVEDQNKGIRGQAVGTKRKIGGTSGTGGVLQAHACITLCAEGASTASNVGATCVLTGYPTEVLAFTGGDNTAAAGYNADNDKACAAGGYISQSVDDVASATNPYICYPPTRIVGVTGDDPLAGTGQCGMCTPRDLVDGSCKTCACNSDASRSSTAETGAECAPGQFSCTPGTCDTSTHSELKTAQGHTLCLRRVVPTWR